MRSNLSVLFLLSLLIIGSFRLSAQTITTIAGNGNYNYSGDGSPATAAQMLGPYGMAFDALGNMYIADQFNHCVRKVGLGTITTIAGNGTYGYSGDGGHATNAQLNYPTGVAVDASGNVYIADENNFCIRKVNTSGIITTYAGKGAIPGYFGDGAAATAALIYRPAGIALDASGNLYIADMDNNAVRKVSAATGKMSTFAGKSKIAGYAGDGGPASAAFVNTPMGVAVDAGGNIFIADNLNSCIRKVNTLGIISTVAGNGAPGFSGDGGAATAATLGSPVAVKVDGSNNIYVVDNGSNCIRKINASGIISTVAGVDSVIGYAGDGGPATAAQFDSPQGIVNDASGNIYISDFYNDRIRKVNTSGIISNYAGGTGSGRPATSVSINPWGIVTDAGGNIYIADADNDRICKISSSGIITTVAGFDTQNGSDIDNPVTRSLMAYPLGVTVDAAGNIYIADTYDDYIRKVNTSGVMSIIAGTGAPGYTGDGGAATAAAIDAPTAILLDATGNIYITDNLNSCIRKINTAGVISTIAGNGTFGYSGDGGDATSAQLARPSAIAIDILGNIYIADGHNNRIRKVNTAGVISTVVGTGSPGFSGDGSPATGAQINNPAGITVDSSGNLYIADGSNRYRKVNALGIINTMAGTGGFAFSGDGGPATAAALSHPAGIAIDGSGVIYISDYNNYRVRKIQSSLLPSIKGSNAVCVGANITLSDATIGGTWSTGETTVATVGSGSGVVTGVSAGTATIIYALSCNTVTKTITVNPFPSAGIVTGASSVCVGSSVSLTDTVTIGAWSSSNTTAKVLGAGVVTGLSAGVDTIKYTVTTGCGTASTTYTIAVDPLPSAIGGTAAVCMGLTIALSDTSSAGVWGSSITATAAIDAAGTVTGAAAGTSVISYMLSTGCAATKIVTVHPLPLVFSVTGGGMHCAGDTGVHVGLSGSVAGSIYQVYKGGIAIGGAHSGTGSAIDLGLDTAAGKYTVVATDPSTGCTNNMDTSASIVTNLLPPAIVGISNVCMGATVALTDTVAGGTWTSSSTALATVGTTGIVAGIAPGTPVIRYTLPVTGCSITATVTVNPLPASISGAAQVCAGSSVIWSDAGGGAWSSGSTAVVTVASITGILTGVAAGTGVITYTLPTGCTGTKSVTVNPLPSAIMGTTSLCIGNTTALSDPVVGGSWGTSDVTIATVGGTGVVTAVAQGIATITYTLSTGCDITAGITVNPPAFAGTITGASSVCMDSAIVLSDDVTGGVWSGNHPAITSVSGSGSITGLSIGVDTIVYTVTNLCGTDFRAWPLTVVQCDFTKVASVHGPSAQLTVYPNPNDGSFDLVLSAPYDRQAILNIVDVIGRKVLELPIITNKVIPVQLQQGAPAGMYLITVVTADGRYETKIMVNP